MTVEMKGPPAITITSEEMVLDAARSRTETGLSGNLTTIQITDWRQGKSLCLVPDSKQATVLEYPNAQNASNDPSDWFRLFSLAAQDALHKPDLKSEPLGEKLLEGRRAVGFRITADRGVPIDLWGDPKTGRTVRIEMTMGIDHNMKMTMSDFVFNAEMDESLFSVEPPPGYTVRHEKVDNSPDEEKDLIEMLREYTKLTSGAFPESLDQMKVRGTYWNKYNVDMMWERFHMACENIAPGGAQADEAQKQKFEDRMLAIMNRMQEKMMQGKPYDAETREMQEETFAIISSIQWQAVAPAKLRANEKLRHKFEEQLRKAAEVKPAEDQGQNAAEGFLTTLIQLHWEDLAPEKLKNNEELKHKFEELVPKILEGKLSDEQMRQVKDEFRNALGDEMLKGVEAWQAEMRQKR